MLTSFVNLGDRMELEALKTELEILQNLIEDEFTRVAAYGILNSDIVKLIAQYDKLYGIYEELVKAQQSTNNDN